MPEADWWLFHYQTRCILLLVYEQSERDTLSGQVSCKVLVGVYRHVRSVGPAATMENVGLTTIPCQWWVLDRDFAIIGQCRKETKDRS